MLLLPLYSVALWSDPHGMEVRQLLPGSASIMLCHLLFLGHHPDRYYIQQQ